MIVYALGTFFPDTHSFGFLGTRGTEEEARADAALRTHDTGDGFAVKIVRQEAGAASGEVVAFYMRGVEVTYEETIRADEERRRRTERYLDGCEARVHDRLP